MGIKDYVTPVCGLVRAGQPWPTKAISSSSDYIIPRKLFLSAFYCVSPFLLFFCCLICMMNDDDGDMHRLLLYF